MKIPASPARAILSVLSLALVVRSVVFVLQHYTPEAFFDFWFWVSDFQLWVEHHYTLHDLVKAHYGQHRIATTRVLLLLDSILFGMHGLSVVLVNLALLAGAGLLLWRLARADGVARSGWALPSLFWIALMVSVGQVENLIFPFQVQFALVCLAACGAAALLTSACGAPGRWNLPLATGAGLCSVAAIFSMASGVLTVPGMLVLLVLRRARLAVWLAYAPLAAAGIAVFFYHYPPSSKPPLFDAGLAVTRVLFTGNFLGSVLTGFPHWAAGAGLFGLVLFLAACWALVRHSISAGRAVASGDAALVALGLAVCLCGPAASLTFRIMMGAEAALVSRYATMSLLFAGVLFGLYASCGARAGWPAWVREAALPLLAAAVLLVVNAPVYDAIAVGWHTAVLGDVQLLRNNVGIEGPAPVIFLGKVDDVRNQVRFLHSQHINMFAPGEGPPPALLARAAWLVRHDWAALPVCRGFVDDAFPIDDSAFLLRGWLADPTAGHSLSWVGAVDSGGTLLGTSRAMTPRADVAEALHLAQPALGFDAGFRLVGPARFGNQAVPVRIVGLDPGGAMAVCALSQPAMVGPIQTTPLEALDRVFPRTDGPPQLAGFLAWHGDKVPFDGPTWFAPSSRKTDATLRFTVSRPAEAGRGVVVPFLEPGGLEAGEISFRLGDGTMLHTGIRWLWDRPAWRAAVLPPDIMSAHGGLREVVVTAKAGISLVAGEPADAVLRADWSRLF